jgi:hypothetical protein
LRREVAELRVRQSKAAVRDATRIRLAFPGTCAERSSHLQLGMAQVSGSSRTPPLSSAILAHIAADWDGFAGIRYAARALPLTEVASDQHAVDATALLRDDEAVRLDTIERGLRLHAHARAVLSDCVGPLARKLHMSEGKIQEVLEALGSVVGSIIAGPGASTDVAASSAR